MQTSCVILGENNKKTKRNYTITILLKHVMREDKESLVGQTGHSQGELMRIEKVKYPRVQANELTRSQGDAVVLAVQAKQWQ
jgi:hypothetical protein